MGVVVAQWGDGAETSQAQKQAVFDMSSLVRAESAGRLAAEDVRFGELPQGAEEAEAEEVVGPQR
jgi:hypothetical protein